MWLLAVMSYLPSISTLRSLSWGLLALSFLALLAGLYASSLNVRSLTTLALQLTLNNFPKTMPNLENGRDSSLPSPELLAQTVCRLADAYRINSRRVAMICVVWFAAAVGSLWLEAQAHTRLVNSIRELHNVEVLSVDSPRTFTVNVPSKDNWPLHGGQQTIRLCDSGDTLPLVAGMVLTKFQYKQQSDCLLIDAQTDVNYLRNSNKRVIDQQGNILFAKE